MTTPPYPRRGFIARLLMLMALVSSGIFAAGPSPLVPSRLSAADPPHDPLAEVYAKELRSSVEILALRPSVDPTRLGATGVSLGGWLAIHTALLSHRIQAVAEFPEN